MQHLFDRVLVRPNRMDLVAALKESQETANAAQPALAVTHAEFLEAVVGSAGSPEGFREWNGQKYCDASGVALVWWTDQARQRRFRILGRRWPLGGFQTGPDLITRRNPPMWFFSGCQCFRRGKDWIVVCPCGEAGPAERLGWMGKRCAACHDREQDGEIVPPRVRVGPVLAKDEASASCFDVRIEDNRLLSVTRREDGAPVLVHEFTGEQPEAAPLFGWRPWALMADDERILVLFTPAILVFRLAGEEWELDWTRAGDYVTACFSPDGDLLALGGEGTEVFTRSGDPMDVEPLAEQEQPRQWGGMRFGDGGRLLARFAFSGFEEEGVPALLVVWERDGDRWRILRQDRIPELQGGNFSPDGGWLAAIGSQGVRIHEVRTGRTSALLSRATHQAVLEFRFLPDGETAVMRTDDESFLVPWRLLLGLTPR